MNEKLYEICEDIVDNESEINKFGEMQSIEEMYEYFHIRVPELSEEEFEDFIVDVLEGGKETKNMTDKLSDDDLEAVAGGFNLGTKVASAGLALMSLLPAVGATNQKSMDTSPSVSTSISQTITKEKVSDSQKSEKVGNFIERAFARCANKVGSVAGKTSLMRAIDKEKVNKKYVKLLLENGADVNAKGVHGITALSYAVGGGHKEIVDLLLEHGANVNGGIYRSKRTVLMLAIKKSHTDVAESLLNANAEVNTQDTYGWTALMNAVENSNSKIAKMILNKGADANIKNNNGSTALMMAAGSGNQEIAEMILNKGADTNVTNNNGWTALMMAVQNGDQKTAELLLEYDAKLNKYNHSDKTVLDIAQEQQKSTKMDNIINMLKEHGAKTYEELNVN